MKTTLTPMILALFLSLALSSCNNEDLLVDNALDETIEITTEEDNESVELNEKEFTFVPERWGIVEGKVDDQTARSNRDILEAIMIKAKSNGFTKFKIGKMDAYFNVVEIKSNYRPSQAAINVPSDFHLFMSDETHIRMQPNGYIRPTLLATDLAQNVIIEGGVLHGDRDEHDYAAEASSHEWGHCLRISGSKNITVKNMTIMDATGDGIDIHAIGHAYDSHYTYTENLKITNNKIIRSRRNGISITDGRHLIIEENEFIDSGTDTNKSQGTAPKWALVIEPVQNGGVVYEIVEDVIVRNNIETGTAGGSLIIVRGKRVTLDGNILENSITLTEASESIISNNTVTGPYSEPSSGVGIVIGGKDSRGYGNERNHDNQAFGNKISNYMNGIHFGDPGIDLHSNTIINCKNGIQILNTRDSKVRNNTIINDSYSSEGIGNKTTDYINNTVISDNTIRVIGYPLRFTDLNENNNNYSMVIKNNDLKSFDNTNSSFNKLRGVDILDNVFRDSGITVVKAANMNVNNNTINNNQIRIKEQCSNITFKGNTISGGCFWDNNTDASNVVKIDNVCK